MALTQQGAKPAKYGQKPPVGGKSPALGIPKKTQLFFLGHQRAEGAGKGSEIQWAESCKCFPALTSIWNGPCPQQILFARARFYTQREFGHWNRLSRSEPQAGWSSEAFGQSSQAHDGIFGVSCESQELYSIILAGPFQLRVFWDSFYAQLVPSPNLMYQVHSLLQHRLILGGINSFPIIS